MEVTWALPPPVSAGAAEAAAQPGHVGADGPRGGGRRIRDDGLAVKVTAPLRVDLVLEMTAGQPGILQQGDGARRAHRFAESGVGVDQRGQVGDRRNLRAARGDFGQRGQPDVGQPEIG